MTLRRRLLILAIAAALPTAVAIGWRGWSDANERTAELRQGSQLQAQQLASELARIVEGKRQLLLALSKIRSVRENENPRCSDVLTEAHEAIDGSTFLALFDDKGMITCGSLRSNISSAERAFFVRARDTGNFAVGDYTEGRLTGRPALHIALAMRGTNGRSQVLANGISLQWLDRQIAERPRPNGAQITVADRNGTVLTATPGAPNPAGERIDENRIRNLVRPVPGVVEVTGSDRIARIIGYAPVTIDNERALYVEYAVPMAGAIGEIKRSILRDQVAYAAALLAAMLLVWWLAERRVAQPMEKLLRTVRAWGEGDFSARAGLPYDRTEFGRLAATIDAVGLEIEQRTRQLAAAKEHAEETTEQLRIIDRAVQASSSPIILVDALADDQPVVYVNAAFERVTQYSAADAIGRNCRFLKDDDRNDESERARLRKALQAQLHVVVTLHNRRKDGSTFLCELSVTPVPNASGVVTHFAGSLRDLSDREAAQLAEREATALLRQVMEATTDSVVAVGFDRRITYMNANARMRLAPGREMVGLDLWELFEDTNEALFRENYDRVMNDRVPVVFETFYPPRRSWFDIHAHPTQGGMTIFFRDIGPRKQAEAALVAAKEQAEAASEAKSHFLATMSHELRTPLNAVIGFAEIIANRMVGPLDAQYAEYGRDIYQSGRLLLQVINDVLDISKIEAGRLQLDESNVNLDDIVLGCTQLVRGNADERSQRIEMVLSDGMVVRADPLRLRQALLNLLSNAIKFGQEGGRIKVEVNRNGVGDVCISVSDQGIGMSPEQIPIALRTFGQVNQSYARTYEGTGLGLPIAKQLIELHGGSLLVESRLGEGTCVTICLPAARIVALAPA